MAHVESPQTRGRLAFARADITPPVGIYHRMWGAALHDRATGVHRPLTATALWLESTNGVRQLLLGLDHCILDRAEVERIAAAVRKTTGLAAEQVHVALSHTHGSAWMSRSRSHLPGGELIAPYLDRLAEICGELAAQAAATARPATLLYGTGRCSLATHRDFPDPDTGEIVCGFHPAGPADDTVLVAKAVDAEGTVLGTVVNYACHPTTLAWENTLITPDYIGAMREVIEEHTGGPCLFLQGASGDLGPREGFVGDPAVADRNGRQLGFAALAALEALPPPGTRFEYTGPVVSGATLGTWTYRPLDLETLARQERWEARRLVVGLPYRADLPTEADTREKLTMWQAAEEAARVAGLTERVRECRAHAERMTRQLARLAALPDGPDYPFPVTVLRLGDAFWVLVPGELYQVFQVTLRQAVPDAAVMVGTVVGDWQPGYLPTRDSYGRGIYQETIAAIGPGSLELLTDTVSLELLKLRVAE